MMSKKLILLAAAFSVGLPLAALEKWGYVYHSATTVEKTTLLSYHIISITGLYLKGTGEVILRQDRRSSHVLRQPRDFVLYPLVSFNSGAEGIALIESEEKTRTAARFLIKIADELKVTGFHFDIESLPASRSSELARFMARLRQALPGMKLSMALFPRVDSGNANAALHDYALLAPHLDYAVVMTYDLHNPQTGPGCVTGVSWAEKNIVYALNYFKPSQIYLGIPAYGYSWENSGRVTALGSGWFRNVYGSRQLAPGEDCVRVVKKTETLSFVMHVATAQTRERLTQLAERYRLAGTALWRIGMED